MKNKLGKLTIVTYNIEFSMKPTLLVETISDLKRRNVDVICLQEVMNYQGKKFIIDSLLQNLGNDWKSEIFIGKETDLTGHGVAILWNSKIVSLKKIEKILLPKLENLTIPEKIVTLLFKILHSPRQKERKAIIGTFSYSGKIIRITSLHLDLVGGISHREKQAKHILKHLQSKEKLKYEIVCGDFNTADLLSTGKEQMIMQNLFINYSYKDATKDIIWTADLYETDFKESIPYATFLFRKLHFHLRRKLDFVWFKGFSLLSSEKLDLPGSDHFPIIAEFEL